jgi:hypothetical protein
MKANGNEWVETECTETRRSCSGAGERELLCYSAISGKDTHALCVVVSETLMKAAGLRVGDGVAFVHNDKTQMVALRRKDDAGHHLSARTGGKDQKYAGMAVRAHVKRKMTDRLRQLWLGSERSRKAVATIGDGYVAMPIASPQQNLGLESDRSI